MEWFIDGFKVRELIRGETFFAKIEQHGWEHWPEEDMHVALNNPVAANREDISGRRGPAYPAAYPNSLQIKYLAALEAHQ
mmetsp:Transcript_2139/g.4666  ORF Transcript_2139/g.4666 Transcript_2139/m.4666 type:complete len:80 (+) Transcript_2139:529-768(+)|eukprot:scaffold574_cov190-Amphora_coffeaeformis.AAC.4